MTLGTNQVVLGQIIGTNKKLALNISRLIETRLLIQANSGGGKSYLIRKILEETHGFVQQIVLDMEGEFGTIRELKDNNYILAGKNGDIPVEVRSAELLARKVLEQGISIIIDLYELKQHERVRFVKIFLDALINAPKELWHECLVVIDEAHNFCPEKGQAESMSAVIDLATRGRKRGFCAVLATQRLSKLHKDTAAELINKLIGRTGLDIDMKRASEELGFTSKAQMLSLRNLEPGEFYAYGPAISNEIVNVKVGEVKTTHPKSGKRLLGANQAPPAEKVREVLEKAFADLPKEAEQDFKDKQSLVLELSKTRRELTLAKQNKPTMTISQDQLKGARQEGFNEAAKGANIKLVKLEHDFKGELAKIQGHLQRYDKGIYMAVKTLTDLAEIKKDLPQFHFEQVQPIALKQLESGSISQPKGTGIKIENTAAPIDQDQPIGKAGREILKFLAMRPDTYSKKSNIAAIAGYAHKGGGFGNALRDLKRRGLISEQDESQTYKINEDRLQEVLQILGNDYQVDTKQALEAWLNRLGRAPKLIYEQLLKYPEQSFTKEQLAEMTGYGAGGGGFGNALRSLCTLTLAVKDGNNYQINQELLQLA